jgi:hypothetical protein
VIKKLSFLIDSDARQKENKVYGIRWNSCATMSESNAKICDSHA